MWKVIIDRRDEESLELSFDARPACSEGPLLFRVLAEEGEIWLPANTVTEVRVRQTQVRGLEDTGL